MVKKSKEIKEQQFSLEDEEPELIVHKTVHKTGTIEKSMSQGVATVFNLIEKRITYLTRDERIAYATLRNHPLLGSYVRSMVRTKRHERGWLNKQLRKYWNPFVGAFHSIYHNKQIRKALNKSGSISNDNW